MGLTGLHFVMSETLGNLLRRKGETFWIIIAVTVSMMILGAFGLLLTNLQRSLGNVGEQVRVVVFLRDDLTPSQRSRLEEVFLHRPEVEKIRFVSKEEAYTEFTRSFSGNRELLAGIEGNPLPASYLLSLKETFRHGPDLERLSRNLSSLPGVEDLEYGKKWLERFEAIVTVVRITGIVIGSLLGISIILIIGTSIQKSVVRRREEFEVLQWAGATRTMIRMPILFEGALLGGASAACALALLACFFWTLQGHLNLNLPFAGLPPPVFFSREIMGGGLATGVGLGILGSFFVTNPVSRNHGA